MAISVINVAKNSLKLTSIQAISVLISLPVTIYVATILVPEEYGVYGFLLLWSTYATLATLGITSAGYREVPVLLGKGNEKEALRTQNITITADMLYSILPFVVILGASLFYPEPIFKTGLILIAISWGISRFMSYWDGVNFLRQNFNGVARGRLISGILLPLLTLVSVHWLKVYALLLAPIGAYLISGIYYWKKGPINFHYTFDWRETVRLVKIGVTLQAATLALWGFRLADRTIIASALSLEQLGIYVYAAGFMMLALSIPTEFGNVLHPILYQEAGKVSNIFEGFRDVKRIVVYLTLGVALIIPIAQLGFHLIVNLITTKYIGSIPIFDILSYNIYLFSLIMIPALILNSSLVNKQKLFSLLYSVGLALNIVFSILVIKLGYGVVGVAWVAIGAQGIVSFMLNYSIKDYLFTDIKEFLRFQIRILVPFAITIPFYFIHSYLGSVTSSAWTFAGISLAAQVIIWSLVIGIFYRDYLSLRDMRILVGEIRRIIMQIKGSPSIK